MGKNVVVIGLQWGDEGKGKVVDLLTDQVQAVARFQGGHNAGHTLVIDGVTYKLSLLPSGLVTVTVFEPIADAALPAVKLNEIELAVIVGVPLMVPAAAGIEIVVPPDWKPEPEMTIVVVEPV